MISHISDKRTMTQYSVKEYFVTVYLCFSFKYDPFVS